MGVLDTYLGTTDGLVPTPKSSLVTGYDFLAPAAVAISADFKLGIGTDLDTLHEALIAPQGLSPQADPTSTLNWTAVDLRNKLLGTRHDLIFLAGHYSANSALAADWSTMLSAQEVAASEIDLSNTII